MTPRTLRLFAKLDAIERKRKARARCRAMFNRWIDNAGYVLRVVFK